MTIISLLRCFSLLCLMTILIQTKADSVQVKQCDSGFYYLPQKGDCDPCYEGCATCSSNQEKDCLSCQSAFVAIQFNNQLLCSKCHYSSFYDNSTSTCLPCNPNCEMCYSVDSCLKCREGYVYNPSTKACYPSSCDYGFYWDSIQKQCLKCPAEKYCTSCQFYTNNDNVIQSQYQLTCSSIYYFEYFFQSNRLFYLTIIIIQSSQIIYASSCIKGMMLSYNQCVCPRGSYLDQTANPPKCVKCEDPNCEQCYSKNNCQYCKKQFFANMQNVCVDKTDKVDNYYYLSYQSLQDFRISNSGQIVVKQTTGGDNYCTSFYSYQSGFGCFTTCPTNYFSLFQTDTNSFKCVQQCPQNYTLNLQRMTCLSNNCSNDISQLLNGSCFHRTCPPGQYFQQYLTNSMQSSCIANFDQCLSNYDENNECRECKIGYIGSNCTLGCDNGNNYYIYSDQCNWCSTDCLSSCQFSIAGMTPQTCAISCPRGYYQNTTTKVCDKCTFNNQVACDPSQSSFFLCEWGEDASKQTCDIFNNLQQNQYISSNGLLQTSSSSCQTYQLGSTLCSQCGSSSMFNLNGICTDGFYRTTKYYVLPDPDEFDPKQYKVIEQCPSGYFVQYRQINNYSYKVCKKFATCDFDRSTNLCKTCYDNFYLINGNCIDDCPEYTYKNSVTRACESPIQYCVSYLRNLCQYCYTGFLTNFDQTLCILTSDCAVTKGYFIDVNNYQCVKCQANCDICDSSYTCQTPSQGYFLQDNYAIKTCNTGYYADSTTSICLKCQDLCNECLDGKTCTRPYTNEQVEFINNKIYINDSQQCQSGNFYDYGTQTCLTCASPCQECYKKNDQCLVCSDTTQVIDQFKCLTACAQGKYSIDYTIPQTSKVQKLCNLCDSPCLECQDTATNCTKCIMGQYLYQKACLLTCPSTHYAKDGFCYLKCKSGYYNTAPEECSLCGGGCSQCVDETTCLVCNTPLVLQEKLCIPACDKLFKINPSIPNSCLPCEIYNCKYCITSSKVQCEQCEDGYELKNQRYCMKKDIDSNQNGNDDGEDQENSIEKQKEQAESIIDYKGKIYEGAQCHFTCNKCKGDKVDECLNCKLSNRVFYNNQYCMCPDETYESGEEKCVAESKNNTYLSILDISANWMVLLSIAFNKTPILSFLLIDILSLGSYQLYLEQLYNYMDKYSLLEILNQSNFSSQIPNFLKTKYMTNVGVFLNKTMLVVEGDQNIDEALRFAKLTTLYIINALPYLIQLGTGLIITIAFRKFNPQLFKEMYPTFLICLYYLTFQDQVLFIGIQLKYMVFNSAIIQILSLIFLGLNIVFNIFMIIVFYKQYQIYEQNKNPVELLISYPTLFVGLLLKFMNALNVIVAPSDFRGYILVAIIGIKIVFEITNLFYISQNQSQRLLYQIMRTFIVFQAIIFFFPAILNSGYKTNKILDEKVLHQLQATFASGIAFEKSILCLVESLFSIVKNGFYLSLLRIDFSNKSISNQQTFTSNFDFDQFTIQDLENILSKKPLRFSKKKSS